MLLLNNIKNMSPSKILFFLCLSFIAGIFLESIIKIPQIFLWAFLFFAVSLIFVFSIRHCEPQRSNLVDFRLLRRLRPPRNDEFIIFGFCLLFLIIGILRVQISEFNIANDKLSKLNGKGEIVATGIIADEPDVRDTSQKLKVKIGDSIILVTANRYPEYKYLDIIKITGKLEAPTITDTFNYKNYLMKNHIYSVMGFPAIGVIGKASGGLSSTVYAGILFLKQKIRASIQSNFLPPQSSILEGTILGDNGAMTDDLKSKLNITGLRHIIAVSGTHVVILSVIIMSLLLAAGLWRGQAFYIAIIFICIYIVLTGLPPSGVRAGIMGGIYLLSQKIGRQTMGSRLITLACAIMLLINPLLLLYDVGFQLSFLAVLGLIYLEPLIKMLVKTSILSTTFAAQIFTMPIMVYNFGNISFVSPITNLLILPIVYWLMIFGFLTSIAGIFSNIIGWILSLPCWFLLTYFVGVINFFSKSWMVKTIANVSWIWLLISYLIIGFTTRILNKKFVQKIV